MPEVEVDAERVAENQLTYAGVLVKYVNFGKGWRHRLFILNGGVLRYYKVFGPSAVNAYALLESYRQQGEVIKIGSEIEVAEQQWKRSLSAEANGRPTPAAGDIHLQVAKIRPSDSDSRKFYINSGTMELRLKADNKEDRWAWLQFLNKAKASWEALSPVQASALSVYLGQDSRQRLNDDAEWKTTQADLQTELSRRRTSPETSDYVMDVLKKQRAEFLDRLALQKTRIQSLLDHLNEVEHAKRQLQTAMIVEQRVRREKSATQNGSPSEIDTDSVSDEEQQGVRNASDDEDEFVDCEPAPSTSLETIEHQPSLTAIPSSSASDWLTEEGPPPQRRDAMPRPAQREKSHSLWSIIKEAIGKDLSKVCLPVYFNEPLSALQKSSEDLEYCELLDKAATFPAGSFERLIHVACCAVSGYASTARRTSKPFNPLLGETYEFVCPEKGFRFISEKVVHHPTIMAAYAEGRSWRVSGDGELRSKFTGPSIQLTPVGVMHLTFHDGDEYTWHKVNTYINNIIVGKLNIDHGGVMHVRNPAHGLVARMKFKQPGMLQFRGDVHLVEGTIEKGHVTLDFPKIDGKWDEGLTATYKDGTKQLIWKVNPPARDPTRHNWGTWVMKLNEMTPGLEKKIAPTDCRLRPDQHYMEVGEFDRANEEKQRLENKQRAARKAAEEGVPLKPRWFEAVPGARAGEAVTYRYKGGYWEARKAKNFEGCRDIFSDNPVIQDGKTFTASAINVKTAS